MSATIVQATLPDARRFSALWSTVTMLGLVILAALVHGYNMFGFPLYLGDEGIYMSQAYAVARLNMLTPYPYWYDHAPAGWILIALWSAATGGFHTFGTAIDSGRTFMLLLHVTSLVLLYRTLLHLTQSTPAAAVGAVLYALSPLTVIYGRMVLLDNIMIAYVLAGTLLLLNYDGQLWRLFVGAILFGIGVLTKESAIFLLPVLVYGVWTLGHEHHTRFARGVWLFGAIATISLYPLYAALRKELVDLSFSSPLNGDSTSITLVGAVLWQLGRGGGAPWDAQGDFFQALTGTWLPHDPWILGLGLLAALWNLARGDGRARLVGLLGVASWLTLARGGQVLDFYVITLLPFMALNVGLAAAQLAGLVRTPGLLAALVIGALAIGYVNLSRHSEIFTLDMTTTQRQALGWIRAHVPTNAQIIIDDDLWVDLRDGPPGQPSFPGAHSHWKVANDPAVYRDLFNNDWRNIDYLVMTPGLEQIFKQDTTKLPYKAYSRSTPVASFEVGDAAIEIRRVNYAGIAIEDTVKESYASFKASHVSEGQVRRASGYTDAGDQAGAMLMAVWMDDQAAFDELWGWARLRLQGEDGRLYHTNEPGVEPRSLTDANTDAALALLLAERRWNEASYGREGLKIIKALWDSSVVTIDGRPHLAAGDWAVQDDHILFAPGGFAPYAYKIFAWVDGERDWQGLVESGYAQLALASGPLPGAGRSAGLPPALVRIDRDTGAMAALPGQPEEGAGFDASAAQVYWRVALDHRWHGDGRALSYLRASDFLLDEWARKGALAGKYAHSGRVVSDDESLALYSAVLPKFLVESRRAGHTLYATKISTAYTNTPEGMRWGDGKDLAEQRWAWMAAAFYLDALDHSWSN
ncbi:MAG TPA: glycosyl hydrolase family 8 [Chloroflexaceae bacterium]|nr:glycosyl hydrolase family 8 [Chloroflexaceae bacterium]